MSKIIFGPQLFSDDDLYAIVNHAYAGIPSIRANDDHDRNIAICIHLKLQDLASKRRRKQTVWKVLNEVVGNYETYLQHNPLNHGIHTWLSDYQPKPMPPKGFNLKEFVKTNFPQYSEKINTLLVFK